MNVRIDISHARSTVRELERQLRPDQIARAIARAINHTSSKAQTVAKRAMLARYNLHRSQVQGKRIKINRAHQRKLHGGIDAMTRPIPLISFLGTHQTRKGVMVTVIKGRKQLIRSAFIQTTKKGRRGVFARGQHKSHQFEFRHKRIEKRGPDLPIEELYSVSTYSTGVSQPVQGKMRTVVASSYTNRLMHEMRQIVTGVTR